MAQRKLIVNAKDEDGARIQVSVAIAGRPGLTSTELDTLAVAIGRKICDSIRGLPYTDFGPEGTTLTIGK